MDWQKDTVLILTFKALIWILITSIQMPFAWIWVAAQDVGFLPYYVIKAYIKNIIRRRAQT